MDLITIIQDSKFKIQEGFIAISTEIYMAYIPRLRLICPKYNQIELHTIDLFGTTRE